AAFPRSRVPWRGVAGAYFAGVGVNSILPARSGDVLRLYLVKRRIEQSTYPTLTATVIAETLFDTVVAGAILVWALVAGLLPALHVLPNLPSIDWHWPLHHPRAAAVIAAVWIGVLAVLAVVGARKVKEFRHRVRQGFAILSPPRRFVTGVVTWQSLSWIFRFASVFLMLRTLRWRKLVVADEKKAYAREG